MPLVRIDIMEGRPPEKIRELHGRVAALVAEILDTPIERVRTYITQFPPEGWGIGGVPADVSRAHEGAAPPRGGAARPGAVPSAAGPPPTAGVHGRGRTGRSRRGDRDDRAGRDPAADPARATRARGGARPG